MIQERGHRSALLLGVGGTGTGPYERVVERRVADSVDFVVGIDVLPMRPPFAFVQGDALRLPFRDQSFDLVVSNAVIEHVGDEIAQRRFVAEAQRVGRSWIIGTPNKWFPIESHTSAVFQHYSPRWRARQTAFTRLLSRREFRALFSDPVRITGWPWSPTFMAYEKPKEPSAR